MNDAVIVNCRTGEVTRRDLTPDELAYIVYLGQETRAGATAEAIARIPFDQAVQILRGQFGTSRTAAQFNDFADAVTVILRRLNREVQ